LLGQNEEERMEPSIPPGNDRIAALQQAYVNHLKRVGHIRTPAVEAAFRWVPRHLFVPGAPLDEVYSDRAINVKPGSSSSQPTVMANMLEQLQLAPGQRVLEIATGTGYNAALMAQIVGERGRVTSIEIDEELAVNARGHLAAAGYGSVQVVCQDGGLGYSEAAPYDRIVVTTGAWDIAPAWWEQLRPDGRLLVPLALLGPGHQMAVAFERRGDHLESVSVYPCTFMMSQGSIGAPIPPQDAATPLRITAHPRENDQAQPPDQVILEKRWTRVRLSRWP
jgi:protein-L-isoaspartate(D-aspartate) O-methyltransferase